MIISPTSRATRRDLILYSPCQSRPRQPHNRHLATDEPAIGPERVERLGLLLRRSSTADRPSSGKLRLGSSCARSRSTAARSGVSGSKALLARTASNGLQATLPAVLSFVREWRARQDAGGGMVVRSCTLLRTRTRIENLARTPAQDWKLKVVSTGLVAVP